MTSSWFLQDEQALPCVSHRVNAKEISMEAPFDSAPVMCAPGQVFVISPAGTTCTKAKTIYVYIASRMFEDIYLPV